MKSVRRQFLVVSFLMLLGVPLYARYIDDWEIVRVPDVIAKQVVRRIVSRYFKEAKNPKTIYFAGENIKEGWLPKIRNLSFVVIPKPELYPYPRKVYYFDEVEARGRRFRVSFTYGDMGCHAIEDADTGDSWSFRATKSRVFGLKLVRVKLRWICA